MANLLRVVVVFLLMCAGFSWAAITPVTMYYLNGNDALFSTPAAACASKGPQSGWNAAGVDQMDSTTWGCRQTNAGGASYYGMVYASPGQCPANSAASGTVCVCKSGFLEKNGQCVSPQDPDQKCAGDFTMAGFGIGAGMGTIRDTKTIAGVVPSGEMCWPYDSASSGCLVNFDRTGLATMPDGSIQSTGTFTMYKGGVGGKACTVEASTEGDTEVSEKCEQKGSYTDSKGTHNLCLDAPKCDGGFGGEVNGVEVCVKDKGGNVIETEKKSETTKPNGDKEQVKETTVCKGNVCTTTTTTNTTNISGGTSTKTETKTEGKEDYCKANANAQQCKGEDDKKGSFGGSCSAGFTCEGDPLQCAIAKDQHARNCQMFDNPTDESKLYNAEVSKGATGDVTAGLPGNSEVDLSRDLSNEDVLGGGSCITDLSVHVWNSDVTLPFSKICGALGYLGWILVAVSSLVAFRIVSSSPKED